MNGQCFDSLASLLGITISGNETARNEPQMLQCWSVQ